MKIIEAPPQDSYNLRSRIPIADRSRQRNREAIEKLKRMLERGMAGFPAVREAVGKRYRPMDSTRTLAKREERLRTYVQLQTSFGIPAVQEVVDNATRNGTPVFHRKLREFNHLLKQHKIDASAASAKFSELKSEM